MNKVAITQSHRLPGRPIPGNIPLVQQFVLDATNAQCILVVEKDAIFQSLVHARIFDMLPMVVITAKVTVLAQRNASIPAHVASGVSGPCKPCVFAHTAHRAPRAPRLCARGLEPRRGVHRAHL